ncbi:MAG: metal ABC transporter solute-binding protein, Zn/Mn family [Pseudonocardiaceae bacterium]
MKIRIAALAVLFGVLSCGSPDQAAEPDGRLTVVASTDVWASVVRAVAGDAVEIETIIDDPAGDPHSYESSPAVAATVAEADLVVFNGGGYDEFMTQILAQAGDKPGVEAFALLSPAASTEATPANEHVWYDLAVVQDVAQNVAEELSQLVPEQATQFTARAQTFGSGLDELSAEVSTIADTYSGARVAMTEPVAFYLIEAAGLTDATPPEFAEAVEEETDPPAAAVAATRDLLTQRQVRLLIYNPQAETPVTSQARSAAQAADVPVVEMTETLPEGIDYLDWMSAQIEALSSALGGA